LTIAEAKAWYEQNSNIAFRSSSQKKTAFKIRSLNWNRALNTNDHNYYVAELPVLFDTPPGFTFSDSKTKANAEKANDVARMLILKDQRNGKMRSALMHIVTDNGELDTASTYGKIGANFSGYIFFTKLDGSFINGYEYKNGKIIRKSRKRTSIQKTSKRISMNDALSVMAPPDPGTCITQTTTVYVRYCTYYSNGEKVCTPWEVEDSFETTYCSGGVNDGGSIGGDSYIEQDEPAPIPPSNQDGNIKSIKYEVPNPCITEVYNRIIDHDCQSKIASMLHTFLNSDQINIDISTNNNLGSGVYGQAYGDGDGTNYHVELHTDILAGCSQEFIGMVFYHEAVHVFLKSHQNTWNTTKVANIKKCWLLTLIK
jgi:hypothetical protein